MTVVYGTCLFVAYKLPVKTGNTIDISIAFFSGKGT